MINHYLYIEEDGTWNWSDGIFSGIATLSGPERVSRYCLERAYEMRNSKLGNYKGTSKKKREAIAQLWEAAKDLPKGKYEYYFNLGDKNKVFKESVKELAEKLGVKYELTIVEN